MKKVLALEEGPGFGGALMSLKYLIEGSKDSVYKFDLISNYHQKYIVSGGNVRNVRVIPRKRIFGKESSLEKFLHHIVGRKAGPAAYLIDRFTFGARYIAQILKYIKQNEIDIVHLNNWPLLNDGGLIAAQKADVPIVMHIRGFEYRGRLIKRLIMQADHVIAISEYIQSQINSLCIPNHKVSMIPNALNVKDFINSAKGSQFRKEIGVSDSEKLVGIIGCLVDWKGHKDFLKACSIVSGMTTNVKFIIVGDTPNGKPDFKIELVSYAKRLGIMSNALFVGHRTDVASAMDACDLIVHASTTPEPFGRVIIEAMSLGKPVIATSAGGPKEIITDHRDGLLVSPNNPVLMASAISRCLVDEKMCRSLGKNAVNKVYEKYDVELYAKRVIKVYDEVVRQRGCQ